MWAFQSAWGQISVNRISYIAEQDLTSLDFTQTGVGSELAPSRLQSTTRPIIIIITRLFGSYNT